MKFPHVSKVGAIAAVLWLAYFLAMAASVQHLAWTFGTVERTGHEWRGWIPALAVDAGLAALAYTIQQRRRNNRSAWLLWVGLAAFALISAAANFYHAVYAHGAPGSVDGMLVAKAVVLSATLPLLVIYLGEIISSDDVRMSDEAAQAQQRALAREERLLRKEERQQELQAKQLELEQQRLLLEQQRSTAPAQPTGNEYACPQCGRTFKNRQAIAAHACNKKPATVAPAEPVSSNGKAH